MHNGEQYFRYGSNDDKRYWRCRSAVKYECKARITTRIRKGEEMMEIQCDDHDHKQLRKSRTNVGILKPLKKYQNKNHVKKH